MKKLNTTIVKLGGEELGVDNDKSSFRKTAAHKCSLSRSVG
jgi:hypothetical protein